MSKPSIPQGTRDFSAAVVRKRNYIFNTIKSVFELYGFEPLETPAMEKLETLMGKYGDEGDKLIFKILNNGDFADSIRKRALELVDNLIQLQKNSEPDKKYEKTLSDLLLPGVEEIKKNISELFEPKGFSNEVVERALRYDLTIPFARYVAMNHTQLTFPFKRYQIQPVWRADRPQRGRYREFYQCDADIVGSKNLLNEVELVNIYATVFAKLGIDVEIKINSRKILQALAEICGGADKLIDITVAIDKLDKIGIDKVKDELYQRGLNAQQVAAIESYLIIDGSNVEKLYKLKSILKDNEIGKQGTEEIEFMLNYQAPLATTLSPITIDFTLARGLNYYTGIIFEIKANNVQMGSIGGGGRYDDLTGLFGVPNIPGVGISFGVDRIYDVMEELKLFPIAVESSTTTKILFFNLGDAESKKAYEIMQQLRAKNIGCELYHEQTKFDKQFKYAEKKGINHIAILGSKELEQGSFNLKNLTTGNQSSIAFDAIDEIINIIKS
jgi:histidyl-tRNA synthetase